MGIRKLASALVMASLLVAAGCAAPTTPGGSAGSDEPVHASEFQDAQGFTEVNSELVKAAEQEGGALVWYDSTPEDQASKILDEFKKEYPFVTDATHVVLRAGDVGARVAQESQADSGTADVVTVDAATLGQLQQRDLLRATDWQQAGVDSVLTPNDKYVATGASVFVFLHNTDKVPESEAPKDWVALTDQKWQGRMGTWDRPYAFAALVPIMGGDEVTKLSDDFKKLSPQQFQSTFPLAQAVGAGEVEVGLGLHHAAQPAVEAGSPIGEVVPDPTPVTLIYSAMPTSGKNTKTGELFATWLTSETGATAYDEITQRGNIQLPGTKAHELVQGHEVSDFPADSADQLTEWLEKLSR